MTLPSRRPDRLIVVSVLPAVVVLAGLAQASDEFLPPLPAGQQWKLAWSDEFDGTQIDPSKWEVMGDWKRRDGFWVKEDSYVDGQGHLVLRTKKDGDRYTCGAVRTRGKFEHRYGYWVCRCKFPTQPGHWPAFWLHCDTVNKIGDGGRDGTEIDIMEKPWREDRTTQNLHWDGYGKEHQHVGTTFTVPGMSEGFHTFGLYWTPQEYVFYVNGQETWRTRGGGVSQVPEYAKLTEEIGEWGGDIAQARLPDHFVVDYVRVYDVVGEPQTVEHFKRKALIAQAANVKPSPQQLAWQQLEFIGFIHYTVNAFTDREWGDGTEDPAIFNPSELDVRQWVRTCKDAGMKMIILTAKHHDGFCLWPSKYTEHSVKNSPYKGGKGDIVGELAAACREAGLKLGLYLSPWDRHEPTYGDNEGYNRFYTNQLRELLTNYGEVTEVWCDGAKGPDAKDMEYDWAGYFGLVRQLQPGAVIFNGPDIRWVGNERGYARESEWSVMNGSGSLFAPVNCTAKDLGSLEALGEGERLIWYPAETDVSIRPGWFYHAKEDDKVKSVEQLLDIYFSSVGYNSVLLLNLPPDRRGLIHENDVRRLREFRKVLDAIFDENLAANVSAKASSVKGGNPAFAADKITDGNKDTYWTTDDWTTAATVEFDLGKDCTFNVAELGECIAVGQRIEEFALDALDGGNWKEFAHGTTVGYKRLLRFDDVTTGRVRLRILHSRVCPTLSGFGLYYAPPIDKVLGR
ncbi:MAG TPA: alpha-L-fucosidase [Sedimentisphaerales bacterium]|nr:alpha-L-fucosidase [Sedimentisphaerales bacterium]HRS12459.1 alpha-L-fucosidase [Sedimentisphaerales bacterium]HRV49098.1 alpha-L-fucosidase [Sedimentisphaerales bacterium]